MKKKVYSKIYTLPARRHPFLWALATLHTQLLICPHIYTCISLPLQALHPLPANRHLMGSRHAAHQIINLFFLNCPCRLYTPSQLADILWALATLHAQPGRAYGLLDLSKPIIMCSHMLIFSQALYPLPAGRHPMGTGHAAHTTWPHLRPPRSVPAHHRAHQGSAAATPECA